MPITQIVLSAPRDAKASWRVARTIRRAVLLFGVAGLTLGAGLLTAGSAVAAAHGSQPGGLVLQPASGAATLKPTWLTTDACPAGFQGSAEMSEFNTNGSYASRISFTVSSVTTAFTGILDGNIGALLHVTNIKKGGTVEFAIGCYSLPGGTGRVKYVQSTFLTLSSTGKSYTTKSAVPKSVSGQQASTTSNGQQAATSSDAQQGSTTSDQAVSSADAANRSSVSAQAEAAWIAAACGLVVAVLGIAWHRRRNNRSRLM